jgi:hypothetical protein
MATPTHPNPPTPEKQALLEAFDQVIKADAEKREKDVPARPPRRRLLHPLVWGCLFALALVGLYLVVSRPAWLFERHAPVESVAIQEASLRLAMSMQFQRIERFRRDSGRLPTTIEEAGPPIAGIRYQARHPDGFTLTGTNGALTLTLTSGQSLRAFVGNSFEIIEGRDQR